MKPRHACILFLALVVCRPARCAPHPLAPLTEEEIRAAATLFRSSPRFPANAEFSIITLDEPPKDKVLAKADVPRRAFAVIYDRTGNRTFEALANLSTHAVDSFKEIPGAQPAITGDDSEIADRIARDDPRWDRALRERGIGNPDSVGSMAWSAGNFGLPGTAEGRPGSSATLSVLAQPVRPRRVRTTAHQPDAYHIMP
jgi:Cu2+-containing amine oxidase